MIFTKGYGFSVDDLNWMCPADIMPYQKAYIKQQEFNDDDYWRIGMYVESAVATAVEHCLNGKNAKSEYINKPLHEQARQNLTRNQQDEGALKLFTALDVQKRNWEIEHQNNGKG